MKRKKNLRPIVIALGVFLGRGAQADTVLDFDIRPAGQLQNQALLQTFGDTAAFSSDGVTVTGFGTPNIGLTWQATGGRWDYYMDSVWSAGQLDSSNVGDVHEVVFAPNSAAVAAVIKSFNFHPYYADSTERYAYNVAVVTNSVIASGPFSFNFLDTGAKVPVSLNYTGSIGQTLTLRLTRVASSLGAGELEGAGGNIAVDDINFAQLPEVEFAVGPQVVTVSPANGQTGVTPDYLYRATITNLSTAIVTNTIQLKFNGTTLVPAPTVTQDGGLTTVSYQATGLLPAGSTNKYTLTYDDNGSPAKHYTNEVQFTVAAYVDILLPAPIVFENFNNTAEGSLPAGWTATNLNMVDATSEPNINVTNLDSAAYTNWTVVDVSRFTGAFDTYSQLYNSLPQPEGEATDFRRVLSVNPSNVVNGVFLRGLATGRMAFGDSGYRQDALGQIVYMFSPDFNLTGQTNIYLSFHSLWEQNQDSIGAVEYSIDMGTTWLPIVYLLDGPDVATNLDSSINALSTFTNLNSDTAYYLDAASGNTNGGFYGAFIGVASNRWSTLAPYISRRVNDNPVESKRVEIFRLPQADNQSKVRLRFAHAGTDSWYFGVDDVGLYSLPSLSISSIVRSGGNVSISWIGAAGTKLQKANSLTNPDWQDVPGTNGASNTVQPASGSQAYYRLVRPY
ncbi:MAG: hypothetical protein ABIQ35_15285 [Verrucomicrobiota bacterium]